MQFAIPAPSTAVLLAATTLLFAPSAAAGEADRPSQRSLSVSAIGSVAAEPDTARIQAGVVSEADTAKEAIARNGATMIKVMEGLKAAGIAARDMQTSALQVEPRYTQAKDGRAATISGYRVVNQLRLTVGNVKMLGEILDQAIQLGANQVSGISLDVANAETLKDEARKQAIANARRRAELYAAAAGVELGQVMQIAEGAGEARPPMAPRALAASAPIEAGVHMLSVEVHVTYALK